MNNIENRNLYYRSALMQTGESAVDKHYILPEDSATGEAPYNNGKLEYLNIEDLTRFGFSRTYKYAHRYDPNKLPVITEAAQLDKTTLLALPNEVVCDNAGDDILFYLWHIRHK